MAQVKLLKIGTLGYPAEMDTAADDITVSSLTTSGAVVDANGITIPTGKTITITDPPSDATDGVNKEYADMLINGIYWQDPVLSQAYSYPPTTNDGDRYIVDSVASGDWTGLEDYIVEYSNGVWETLAPDEGMATWVEDEDSHYLYNGSNWVKFSSVYDHNNLSGLQGGTAGEYYHMTAAEDTWLATVTADIAAANVADLSDNESVTGEWDFSSGGFTFPNSSSNYGTPAEGDTYWDGSNDILYIYDGAVWKAVTGYAQGVRNTYTADGTGINAYAPVYISAADTVSMGDASTLSTSKIFAIAPAAISASASGEVQENGVIPGALTGATPGQQYWLSTTAGQIQTSRPSNTGEVVFLVGYAKNSTDLQMQLQFVGVRG